MATSPAAYRAKIRAAIRQSENRQRAELQRAARKIESQSRGRIKIRIR